jgi:hypothetical protein
VISRFVRSKLLATAIASALGTDVYALPPSARIDYTFYAAGSADEIPAVYWAVTSMMYPGTVDVYTDSSTGGPSSNYLIISGEVCFFDANTCTSLFDSGYIPPILFIYRINGSDFDNGIVPQVGAGSTLSYPATASLLNATTVRSQTSLPLPTYKFDPADCLPSACGVNAQVPDWGLLDEEPSLFNFFANRNGDPALTMLPYNVQSLYNNVFGIAVTNTLYNGTPTLPHPKTNFTRAEMVGILRGTISDWSQLFGDDGAPLTAGPIALLDSGSGTGLKVAGNQYFLSYPGSATGYGGGALYPESVSGTNVNNYTGTALTLPITNHQDVKESSSIAIVNDLQSANAAGVRAIAILSLQYPPAGNQYSFTKINGVGVDTGTTGDNINGTSATKYTNVITGNYDFFYQSSFNTRSGFLGNGTANAIWAQYLQTQFLSPNISGAHSGRQFPFAVPGVLLDPNTTKSAETGTVYGTRKGISAAPLQLIFDASSSLSPLGSDPL